MRFDVKTIERDKVELILKWCEAKFGKSKFYKKYPKLRVYRTEGNSVNDSKDYQIFGHFTRNGTIIVFLGSHRSVKELCVTIIHEYKHYLLGYREFQYFSRKMFKDGRDVNYIQDHHPHELKIARFEKRWGDVCFKELKRKLYDRTIRS